MNLNKQLSFLQEMPYEAPAAYLYSLEIEDPLAKSNTETIDEDDEEYDWGD